MGAAIQEVVQQTGSEHSLRHAGLLLEFVQAAGLKLGPRTAEPTPVQQHLEDTMLAALSTVPKLLACLLPLHKEPPELPEGSACPCCSCSGGAAWERMVRAPFQAQGGSCKSQQNLSTKGRRSGHLCRKGAAKQAGQTGQGQSAAGAPPMISMGLAVSALTFRFVSLWTQLYARASGSGPSGQEAGPSTVHGAGISSTACSGSVQHAADLKAQLELGLSCVQEVHDHGDVGFISLLLQFVVSCAHSLSTRLPVFAPLGQEQFPAPKVRSLQGAITAEQDVIVVAAGRPGCEHCRWST